MHTLRHISALALILLASGGAQASIPVPDGLRNPFEVPDPAGFHSNTARKGGATISPEEAAQNAAFAKIETQLRSLPVKGFAASVGEGGRNTLLLGPYVIQQDSQIPTQSFGVPAMIKVVELTRKEMVLKITVGLETRKSTIPLAL